MTPETRTEKVISLCPALSPQNTHLCSPEPPGMKFNYPEAAILERPGVKPLRHRERFSSPLPPCRCVSKASRDPSPRPASHPRGGILSDKHLSLDCRSVSKIIAVAVDRHTILELYVVQ